MPLITARSQYIQTVGDVKLIFTNLDGLVVKGRPLESTDGSREINPDIIGIFETKLIKRVASHRKRKTKKKKRGEESTGQHGWLCS